MAISDAVQKQAETWLHGFAHDCGIGYDDIMRAVDVFLATREPQRMRGLRTPAYLLESEGALVEFWSNWEIVTGIPLGGYDEYHLVPKKTYSPFAVPLLEPEQSEERKQ